MAIKPPLNWSICIFVLLSGCQTPTQTNEPNLTETLAWMQNALKEHNGARLSPPIKDVVDKHTVVADHCKLTYELTNFDTVQFDLADIDTKTIKVEKIGDIPWVTFKTRDFHHSVHYTSPADNGNPAIDYTAENGGFSLDGQDVATSFAKALARAANLCGSRGSTF
jgi:hypothetical protein